MAKPKPAESPKEVKLSTAGMELRNAPAVEASVEMIREPEVVILQRHFPEEPQHKTLQPVLCGKCNKPMGLYGNTAVCSPCGMQRPIA